MKKVLFTVLFVLAIAEVVLAADGATVGDLLKSIFTDYVAPIVGSFIVILISIGIKKAISFFGIKLSAEQEAYVSSVADKLVRAVEEKAAAQIKIAGDKAVFPGSEKLVAVVSSLMAEFPKLTEDQAYKIAQAAVNRIPGVGLTGN